MVASSALTLLESLAHRAEDHAHLHGVHVRTQVALVRALVDEIRRHPESEHASGSLFDQLEEETQRLVRMLRAEDPYDPASGVHRRS